MLICGAAYTLLVVVTKINMHALQANFECNCLQTRKVFRNSYKINTCTSLVCSKFKFSCSYCNNSYHHHVCMDSYLAIFLMYNGIELSIYIVNFVLLSSEGLTPIDIHTYVRIIQLIFRLLWVMGIKQLEVSNFACH